MISRNYASEKEQEKPPQRSTNDGRALQLGVGGTGPNVNSVNNQDSIVFPDRVPKVAQQDSYGNPVTPFTTLPDVPASNPTFPNVEIGHHTDVNKQTPTVVESKNSNPEIKIPLQPTTSAAGGPSADSLGFILPSYASGITKLETFASGTVTVKPLLNNIPKPGTNLLPPLSNGNYNFADLTAHNYQTQQQPLSEVKKPITTTTTTTTPSYNNGQFSSQGTLSNYNRFGVPENNQDSYSNINLQSIPQQPQPGISDSLKPPKIPQYNEAIIFPKSDSTGSGIVFGGLTIPTNKPAPQIQTTQSYNTNVQAQGLPQSGKYSGSFGGAPGILSPYDSSNNQQVKLNIGTLNTNKYQATPQLQQQATSTTNKYPAAPQLQQQQAPTSNKYQAAPQLQQQQSQYQQSQVAPQSTYNNQNNQYNAQLTAAVPTQQAQSKYGGTFGGPPGVLSPYDNVKKH